MLLKYLKHTEMPQTTMWDTFRGNSRVNSFHFIEGQDSFISTEQSIVQVITDVRNLALDVSYKFEMLNSRTRRSSHEKQDLAATCQIIAIWRF